MNIIEEIFYGNIKPNEKAYKNNTKYEELIKNINKHYGKLQEMLDEKSKEILAEMPGLYNKLYEIECREMFVEGWQLGARFVLDTFICEPREPFCSISEIKKIK